jgi:hypothetical protein
MRHLYVMLPLMLAACGSGTTVTAENASVAEVNERVKAAGQAIAMKPGHWDSTVTVTKMDIPGLPPAAAAQLQGEMTKPRTSGSCLTEEEAKKPAADFFAGKNSKACRYDRFRMTDGTIDAQMTCSEGGQAMQAAFSGTYEPERFKLDMTMKGVGGAAAMPAMAMTVDARHTGACKPGER